MSICIYYKDGYGNNRRLRAAKNKANSSGMNCRTGFIEVVRVYSCSPHEIGKTEVLNRWRTLDLKSEMSCDMLSQGAMLAAQVICVSSARQWIVTGRILSLP